MFGVNFKKETHTPLCILFTLLINFAISGPKGTGKGKKHTHHV